MGANLWWFRAQKAGSRPMKRRVFCVVLLLSLSSLASDNSYLRLKPEVVNDRLRQLAVPTEQRPTMLRKAFADAGCTPDEITEQTIPGSPLSNVICRIPGTGPGSIIVAAGVDYNASGDELLVNDATLEMLPLLIQSFHATKPDHSLVFIGFSGAKKQAGSNYFLSQLSKEERSGILGMVFLDHLGRSPVRYLFPSQWNSTEVANIGWDKHVAHDTTALNKQLDVAAKAVGMDYPPELEEFFFTHALSFEHKNLISLTLSSPAYTILVRPKNADAKMLSTTVNFKDYYETYNLLCVYLLKLDDALTSRKHVK
jgi:hypothetical protein